MKIVDKKTIIIVIIAFCSLVGFSLSNLNSSYAILNSPIITSLEPQAGENNALRLEFYSNNAGYDYSYEIVNINNNKKNIVAGSAKFYVYQNLKSNTTYLIKIRVCTNANNSYSCSAWATKEERTSNPESTVEKPQIINIEASQTSVKINYSISNNINGVAIYNDNINREIKTTNKSTYTWNDLEPNTTYRFKIRSYISTNGFKYSDYIEFKSTTLKENQSTNSNIKTNIDTYTFANINKTKTIKITKEKNASYSFTSSNNKIVTVSESGKLTSKKAGNATITIKQILNNKEQIKKIKVYVPNIKSREKALKPYYDAIDKNIKILQKANPKYNWGTWARSGYTLKGSLKGGTCITFPSTSLMRAGLLKEGDYITVEDGKNFNRNLYNATKKRLKKSRYKGYFTNHDYFNQSSKPTVKKLVKKKILKKGDIIHYPNHTLIYMGKSGSKYKYAESGHASGHGQHNWARHSTGAGNGKVAYVTSVNAYNIYTTATNCTITKSNKYMASTNAKIKYEEVSGYKVKTIKVDNKNVKVSKYKNSYTFKNIRKKHTISVECTKE